MVVFAADLKWAMAMAALAGIKSNILLSAGRVRQVAVGCRYFNMAKWLVHRKSGRPKQVAVHPRDRQWQVLLYWTRPYSFWESYGGNYFLLQVNTVDTPTFVSSYRLEPVGTGWNRLRFANGTGFSTVDTLDQLMARENDMPLKITTSAETTIRPWPNKRQVSFYRHGIRGRGMFFGTYYRQKYQWHRRDKRDKANCQLIQREHFVWPGVDVDRCSVIPGPPVITGQSPNCLLRRTYEQCTQNHV